MIFDNGSYDRILPELVDLVRNFLLDDEGWGCRDMILHDLSNTLLKKYKENEIKGRVRSKYVTHSILREFAVDLEFTHLEDDSFCAIHEVLVDDSTISKELVF